MTLTPILTFALTLIFTLALIVTLTLTLTLTQAVFGKPKHEQKIFRRKPAAPVPNVQHGSPFR